jgi:hypothetical protein
MNVQLQNLEITTEEPAVIQVFQAFDKVRALREASFQQQHYITNQAWLDLGIVIHLSGEEEVKNFWDATNIRVWLDQKEIPDAKRFSIGPYPFYIDMLRYSIDGYAMRMALIVPPLSTGDHQVDWKLSLEKEIWDRGDVYEAGTTWNVRSLLHVSDIARPSIKNI